MSSKSSTKSKLIYTCIPLIIFGIGAYNDRVWHNAATAQVMSLLAHVYAAYVVIVTTIVLLILGVSVGVLIEGNRDTEAFVDAVRKTKDAPNVSVWTFLSWMIPVCMSLSGHQIPATFLAMCYVVLFIVSSIIKSFAKKMSDKEIDNKAA